MAASTSAVSMATALTHSTPKIQPVANAFLKPMPLRPTKVVSATKIVGRFRVNASLKGKMVSGLTAGALIAAMVVPEVAEAASELSPSLKNFLLSIVSGGVVLGVILGAVIAVSNFDPVKRS